MSSLLLMFSFSALWDDASTVDSEHPGLELSATVIESVRNNPETILQCEIVKHHLKFCQYYGKLVFSV